MRAFSSLPPFARQSFTFDLRTEFAAFTALEDEIGAMSCSAIATRPGKKRLLPIAFKYPILVSGSIVYVPLLTLQFYGFLSPDFPLPSKFA